MIQVNLHPQGSKRRKRTRSAPSMPGWLKSAGSGEGRDPWLMAAVGISAIVLLTVGWLWMSQRGQRSEVDRRTAEAVEDSTRLSDLRMLSDSLIAREGQIRERLELVQGLDGGRFTWPRLLDEFSRALPDYAWLTSIRQASAMPELQVQIDGLAANPLAITAYVRQLQESPYVGGVRILGSQEQNLDGFSAHSFKLIVTYAEPAETLAADVVEGA